MCGVTVINSLVIQACGQTEWRIKSVEVAAFGGADKGQWMGALGCQRYQHKMKLNYLKLNYLHEMLARLSKKDH